MEAPGTKTNRILSWLSGGVKEGVWRWSRTGQAHLVTRQTQEDEEELEKVRQQHRAEQDGEPVAEGQEAGGEGVVKEWQCKRLHMVLMKGWRHWNVKMMNCSLLQERPTGTTDGGFGRETRE